MNFLAGYKTHIVVAVGLLTILGSFLAGDMTLQDAAQRALEMLGLSTIRIGIANK